LANSAVHNFVYPCNDDRFEEVNVYYHLDRTQRKLQSLGFIGTGGIMNKAVSAHAHHFAGCNAYYHPISQGLHFGDFNDLADCGGAPPLYDAAEDADVVVHEYGHAIHDNQVPGWGFGPYPISEQTGAMGEGFSDFLSASMSILAS
jgi:hypothetical protein